MKPNLIFIIFIVAIAITSCGDNKQNTQTQKAKMENPVPKEIKVVNNGLAINYKTYGKGKYTLLFVHGWCINQSYWSDQIEALSPDFRIVSIDLPGFGASGKNREKWSIENYGSDIRAVIDQLDLTNVILIGHSMGGNVILEGALNNKDVIALIGVDNFKDVGIEFTEESKAEINGFVQMLKDNFSEVVAAYAEGFLFHPSTDSLVKARVIGDFQNNNSTIAISTLESLFEYASVESTQLSKLQQKLYLINSDATPTNTAGLDKTGIDYEVIDINATGHYPMIEKPAVFTELLKQTIHKITEAHTKQ